VPDGPDTLEKLFARAEAAVRESWSLVAKNHEWRKAAETKLRRMHFRASFEPKTLKFFSLLDFHVLQRDRVPPHTSGALCSLAPSVTLPPRTIYSPQPN